jgi:hypothetical protein
MVRITTVHMAGGEKHEHIESVKWIDPADSKTGSSTRAQMVEYIEAKKGRAVVGEGMQRVGVGVVDATPKYIRTYADGNWTNNLLALPRY